MTTSSSALDTVRARFEREAVGFDAIYRLERSPFWRWFNTTFRKAIFERYEITFREAGDVRGKKVLDIGCGSGVYAAHFAELGAQWVLGVDFSAEMLRLAQQEANRRETAEQCSFIQANFLDIELHDTFDVSVAMGVFDYLPDPQTFLNKLASVTTGKVIASFPGHSLIRERARRLRYALARKGGVYFYDETHVRRLAERAGLGGSTIIPIHSSGTGFVLVGQR